MNYYEILNINKHTSSADLYKEFARLYKSLEGEDKNLLKEAFDVLSNSQSKQIYDDLLEKKPRLASKEALKYLKELDKRFEVEKAKINEMQE